MINYNRSAELLGEAVGDVDFALGEAVGDVDFATSKSVATKWLEMAGDIVAALARFLPEGGPAINLVITIFKDTYNNLSGSSGDINEAITQIYTDLNNQKGNLNSMNASQQTAYLIDYSKLQQIGLNSTSGGYDWASATLDVIADAQNGAAQGMLLNFYRILIPYKWYVIWCSDPQDVQGGPFCGSIYTPAKYDCVYGPGIPSSQYDSEAYIYAGVSYDVNWGLADKFTGTGAGDLNAIWYMMLLGSDAGWDLPSYRAQYCSGGECNYTTGSDPVLKNLPNNPPPYNTGCNGNGIHYGTVGRFVSNAVSAAHDGTAEYEARYCHEADGILERMRRLKREAKPASPADDAQIELISPLREAATLIERGKSAGRPGQEGSVSATRPHISWNCLSTVHSLMGRSLDNHAQSIF